MVYRVSGRRLWFLLFLFPLLIAACGGISVGTTPYGPTGANAPESNLFAPEAGPVVNDFPELWNKCGKSDGIGEWIVGPKWYRDRYLVMIYRNAVLAWDARRPEKGVFLLALNGNKVHRSGKGIRVQNASVINGVAVPGAFVKWIGEHGGFACSGNPVGDLTARGDLLCQKFANITLCYSRNGGIVYPLPIGQHFFETHKKLLTDRPETQYLPNWFAHPAIEAEGENLLKISASPGFGTSPSTPPVVLAVQVRKVQVRKNAVQVRKNSDDYPFYYRLVRLRGDFFSDTVKVPKPDKGSTRFEVEVCLYSGGKWVTCDDNSTRVWNP